RSTLFLFSLPPNSSLTILILRRLVTRLVREERCEFPLNRAVEVRQYMERLLQLGIFRERDDPYMNEMVDWWLIEGDLREKFFDVLVPRFAHDPGNFIFP
uniref:Large ribosomal subunit protein bL17m n=1 Tax=Parascaris equorum TaxID=6256 RepID=A0A914RA70_PAREQ